MQENSGNNRKATHIVSAQSQEDRFCIAQKAVEEKSNEIAVIPELLEKLQVKGQIVNIDDIGIQKQVVKRPAPIV